MRGSRPSYPEKSENDRTHQNHRNEVDPIGGLSHKPAPANPSQQNALEGLAAIMRSIIVLGVTGTIPAHDFQRSPTLESEPNQRTERSRVTETVRSEVRIALILFLFRAEKKFQIEIQDRS